MFKRFGDGFLRFGICLTFDLDLVSAGLTLFANRIGVGIGAEILRVLVSLSLDAQSIGICFCFDLDCLCFSILLRDYG